MRGFWDLAALEEILGLCFPGPCETANRTPWIHNRKIPLNWLEIRAKGIYLES